MGYYPLAMVDMRKGKVGGGVCEAKWKVEGKVTQKRKLKGDVKFTLRYIRNTFLNVHSKRIDNNLVKKTWFDQSMKYMMCSEQKDG